MPLTYPSAPATVTGDLVTVHQLLRSPAVLQRRILDLAAYRFISDALLTGRYPVKSGSLLYYANEQGFADRDAQQIAPGGEYPRSPVGLGPPQIAQVGKWGEDVPITDESISRELMNPVTIALIKLVNTMVRQVDALSIAAIASAVTAARAATAIWTGSSAVILRDVLLAVADVRGLNQGFEPDLAVVDDLTYAYVASDPTVTNAWARESRDSPIYTGRFVTIGGITFLPSPALNIPFGGTSAFVLDSTQLGGLASEDLGGPGYVGALKDVETKILRDDDTDEWRVRARRVFVPVVKNPTAAIRITGVRA